MIYLITGVPGSGKTSLLVSLLLKLQKDTANPRLVYQHGVRGLKLPAVQIYCDDLNCEFCGSPLPEQSLDGVKKAVDDIKASRRGRLRIEDFRDWCPPNGVIVLDEVQQQYRVRGRAAPVPKFVMDLEVNRHSGVDLYLLTQNPKLIDSNIRDLFNVHYHLEPNLLGIHKRTFMGCEVNPRRATTGETVPYKPDPATFEWYNSAELHTKIKKPIPKGFYVLGVALLFGVVGGYFALQNLTSRFAPQLAEVQEIPQVEAVIAESVEHVVESVEQPHSPDFSQAFDTTPTIPGVLESAPAFAGMVRYRDHPRRAACILSGSRCRCYTQQGTDYPTALSECKAFIEGRVSSFNPYRAPVPMVYGRSSAAQAFEGGSDG